jgi:23S rRNA (uracil1939-C5)-methyltransferase
MEAMPADVDRDEGLDVERVVAGGVGLAREPGGRVVLVEGALPGERVRVRLTEDKARMARGVVEEVLEASPIRVEPPCPELARGCGGCDLQHAAPDAQRDLKVGIVRDALARLARSSDAADVPVDPGVALAAERYRTTVRAAVVDGSAGFHLRRSEDVLAVADCLVAHPLVAEVLADGRFPDATEITVRAGARTGERMVVVTPSVGEGTVVPDGVRVIGADELAAGRRAWIHEEVDGRRYRVSALSFFQVRPDGAEALLDAVRRALGDVDPGRDRLVDLYGGVGLFAAGLGTRAPVLVERSASSVADARRNLEGLDATVVRVPVEKWRASAADLVVADPARTGLGPAGVTSVAATGARRVALVSCDPASLARDVAALAAAGYRALGVELVDLFPQTHHVEAVTSLERR